MAIFFLIILILITHTFSTLSDSEQWLSLSVKLSTVKLIAFEEETVYLKIKIKIRETQLKILIVST